MSEKLWSVLNIVFNSLSYLITKELSTFIQGDAKNNFGPAWIFSYGYLRDWQWGWERGRQEGDCFFFKSAKEGPIEVYLFAF